MYSIAWSLEKRMSLRTIGWMADTMATPNISVKGTVENLLNLGFTNQDAIFELIDNSFDAGATDIRLHLTPSALVVSDNGRGMTRNNLRDALCINNTKPGSESIGVRGLGLKAGHACLSKETSVTRIFSKNDDDDVVEIEADWPSARMLGTWNPVANDITVKRMPTWDTYRIDSSHGTVTEIPIPRDTYDAIVGDLPGFLEEIGRTYESQLVNGVQMSVNVNGTLYSPDMRMALGWDDTPAHLRFEIPVELWKNADCEERVYYEHTSLRPRYTEMVRNPTDSASKSRLRDYSDLDDNGFTMVARVIVRMTYRPEWNPSIAEDGSRPAFVPGYIATYRNGRGARRIPLVVPNSGDYEMRRIVGSRRVAINFGYESDDLFGVQVNKSNISPENIHSQLFQTISALSDALARKIYTEHYKTKRPVLPTDKAREARLNKLIHDLKLRKWDDELLDHCEVGIAESDERNEISDD